MTTNASELSSRKGFLAHLQSKDNVRRIVRQDTRSQRRGDAEDLGHRLIPNAT
jgi:hypothetical protein